MRKKQKIEKRNEKKTFCKGQRYRKIEREARRREKKKEWTSKKGREKRNRELAGEI